MIKEGRRGVLTFFRQKEGLIRGGLNRGFMV